MYTKFIKLFVFLILGISSSFAQLPKLQVVGNQIQDFCGRKIILRGVSIKEPNMEIAKLVVSQLDINVLRIVISPYYLKQHEECYKNLIPVIEYCESHSIYVILDLHIISNVAPYKEVVKEFWKYLAPKFKDNSNVIFELYNEPELAIIEWNKFKPIMQDWVNTIRDLQIDNIIIASSPSWCQLMGDAADDPIEGGNIVYSAHIYPNHWVDTSYINVLKNVERCAVKHPVMVTEWGFGRNAQTLWGGTRASNNHTISEFGTPFINWSDKLGLSWVAWIADNDWQPTMFDENWKLKEGEDEMGIFIKEELLKKKSVIPICK